MSLGAQLRDSAAVSKTAGLRVRFLRAPLVRLRRGDPRSGRKPTVAIVAYLLFFLAGVGFGFAAPGRLKWLPLLFPVVLAVGAAVRSGVDAAMLLRLVLALVVTALGVVLGRTLDDRARRRSDAAPAA
jgi:fatty acid desaturase